MNNHTQSRFSRAACLALLPLIGMAMSACQNSQAVTGTSQALVEDDYRLRHPIVLAEAMETLDLPVGYSSRKLGSHLTGSVVAFADQAVMNGNGQVEILVPSGAGNEQAVHALAPQIRKALAQGGVDSKAQMLRSYAVEDPNSDAPIRLAYARIKAVTGPCGEWPRNIGGSPNQNVSFHNFGCSYQANLAAMVSNPADLVTPRAVSAADQQRRATVFEGYRSGKGTSSTYTEGVGAEIAE